MSNLEEIKLAFSSSLPGLSDETLKKFIHGLSAIGVETKDDLQYVKEEDLMEFLRPIQCRKLLNEWKNEEQSSCTTPQRSLRHVLLDISSPGSESSSSTASSSTACFSASCAWAEIFKVPWEVMSSEIKLAIANKKRPSPADRRKLVRMLVDNMQKHEVNPSKAQCQIVVQNIVKQYPDSFADVLSDGTKIGSGYASLLLQVKTCVEHVNRNNTLARRRKERLRSSCRTISQSSRRLADQYGCVSWQPEEFPAGENDDTLEEKHKQMVLFHSTEGMSGANRGELHKLMEVTYYSQRRDKNATPPLSELKNSWPYLFCLKGIFLHFQLLTDISLLQKIMESIQEKGKRILRFFQEKPSNKEVCAVLSKYQEGNSLVLCILKLLMAHFKERTESLLIEADAAATAADMEREGLPDSPALIIQGLLLYFVSIIYTIICFLALVPL
ncbi:uncharacterized protein LOC117593613 [Esox lucius]|uniref:uncharacterized protein LOC117593613 n=1 Tax=Esox lucius TaxID=8010 RepID=UPI001476D706|nr:uncharacterized protein LOC117593613 [Esox lucius]XP_034145226.1 uncharacterized protein LOC117593613 [Esox lucius]